MYHVTTTFHTPDGLKIHTESWMPEGEPRALVLIVHGYAEHIGRYQWHAEHLVERGYAVYGIDHRGHGKSDGVRAYFDNFDHPVDDLKQAFDQIEKVGKKLFVWGHSMGSLIALSFALRHQSELAGLILSGTAVNGDELVPSALAALGRALNRLIPRTPLTPALPSAILSHDSAIASTYDTDPLIYRGAWRIRTGTLLLNTGKQLRARAPELILPLLILHGGEDQVVPVSGSEIIFNRASSSDKTLKIYPGLYHEIHNELEKATVLDDIANWLDHRTA
jgi:alpha-beta hydrolase superfamily lysophospholipase